jgi:hypothetical protein
LDDSHAKSFFGQTLYPDGLPPLLESISEGGH